MKNIQIIDKADNCTFSIFVAEDAEFALIFPDEGQDIEFSEDLHSRLGSGGSSVLNSVWGRPIRKAEANGIHGTLFFGFGAKRPRFPSTKRERDWDPAALNDAQRRLYGAI